MSADLALERMRAALRSGAWRALNLALRDAIVDHAVRTVPYYREVIPGGAGFDDIPLLTKAILRARHDELLSGVVPEARRVGSRTSGSSDGVPLRFVRDAAQGPLEYDAGRRLLLELQGIPADATKVWVATRPSPFPGLSDEGDPPGLIGVPTQGLDERRVRRLLRRLRRLDRWYFYGHPSTLAWIARIAGRMRRRPSPLAVVTTAETLTPDARRAMEEVFGCPVHSWYGSNEFNGFVMGTEPGARRYVYNPLLVYAEVLDDHGRAVGPGETGRLVLTDLNNRAMPFIRYDTGDLAVAGDPNDDLPRVGEIVGRSSEVIVLENGVRLTPVVLGWKLFIDHDLEPFVDAWQCAQVDARTIEMRVVWRDRSAADVLARAFREIAGDGIDVVVRSVDELDRLPSGKAWVIRGAQAGAPGLQMPQAE